jgi:glycosyltransferase involved in cell wall biosynthesis
MKTAAVVTTYNERETIGGLVSELFRVGVDDVVVADAGSLDRTWEVARCHGAFSFDVGRRAPFSHALPTAWRCALGRGAERIVQIDAGGSHDPAQVPELLMRLNKGCEVVVGSRFLPESRYVGRSWRKWASALMSVACNASTGAYITDWTSGYRAFSREAARYLSNVRYHARMHPWQAEVLGAALRVGLRVGEAPIRYVAGASAFRLRMVPEALSVVRDLR